MQLSGCDLCIHSIYFWKYHIHSTSGPEKKYRHSPLYNKAVLANQQKNITVLIYCYELEPSVIVWSDLDSLQEH